MVRKWPVVRIFHAGQTAGARGFFAQMESNTGPGTPSNTNFTLRIFSDLRYHGLISKTLHWTSLSHEWIAVLSDQRDVWCWM